MINKAQAEAIVAATTYRDWDIHVLPVDQLSMAQLLGQVSMDMQHKIAVVFSYQAIDTSHPTNRVQNDVAVAIPLPETEAEFARALYEVISIVEEHERREFFKIAHHPGVMQDRVTVEQDRLTGWRRACTSTSVFHPHGVNRNKLFHDLDEYAKNVKLQAMNGEDVTADAV